MVKYVYLSTNDDPLYVQFWPIVATVWRKWGYTPLLSLVTDKPREEWQWMEEYGEVFQYDPRPEIPAPNWAKVSRFFNYYRYPEKGIGSDIDMIPLNKDYFDSLFEYDGFVIGAYDSYKGQTWAGEDPFRKFAGCYMVADGETWREIVNPQNLSEDELVKSFYDIREFCEDGIYKEGINFEEFSEESLIRVLLKRWGGDTVKLKRPGGWNPRAVRRIDRAQWEIDPQKLKEGYYLDCHSLRPLEDHINELEPIFKHLKINVERVPTRRGEYRVQAN